MIHSKENLFFITLVFEYPPVETGGFDCYMTAYTKAIFIRIELLNPSNSIFISHHRFHKIIISIS